MTIGAGPTSAQAGVETAIRARAATFFQSPSARVGPIAVVRNVAVANYEGDIENSPESGQMVYEHFSFGWQLVGLYLGRIQRCQLNYYGISDADRSRLLRYATAVKFNRYADTRCPLKPALLHAVTADEVAIRALVQGKREAILDVTISGKYARVSWEGFGGGQDIFVKNGGVWHRLTGGGGYLGSCGLMQYGVPRATAQKLFPEDHQKC